VPNETKFERAAAIRSSSSAATVAATRSASRSSRIAAIASTSTPRSAASVARRTLRKPCCSWPVSGSVLRTAWCRPAVALNGIPAATTDAMPTASSAASGCSSGRTPPVRNFARYPVATHAAIASARRASRGISM